MPILLALGIMFALLGVAIRYLKWYWLIVGYNTMSGERKQKVDIGALGVFMGNCLFLLAGIMVAGSVMIYFKVPGVSGAVPVASIILIIYMLIRAQQFDTGSYNPDGTMKLSVKLVLGSILAVLAIIVMFIFSNTSASEVLIADGSVQIKGIYGIEVMMQDIHNITLEESIPAVLRKTNGFSAGSTLKGYFELQSLGRVRLYINADKPPFIFINSAGGLIIVNQGDRQNTEELYRVLLVNLGP